MPSRRLCEVGRKEIRSAAPAEVVTTPNVEGLGGAESDVHSATSSPQLIVLHCQQFSGFLLQDGYSSSMPMKARQATGLLVRLEIDKVPCSCRSPGADLDNDLPRSEGRKYSPPLYSSGSSGG